MFTKARTLVGFLIAISLAAPAARAETVPSAVDRAYQAIRQDGSIVMSWAYPTVTFDQVSGCLWEGHEAAYTLTCRLEYVDGQTRGSRVLSFQLDGHGFITSIADRGGTDFWPPFVTIGLATISVTALAREGLETETDSDKRALLGLLARAPDPKIALAAIMNLRILARG